MTGVIAFGTTSLVDPVAIAAEENVQTHYVKAISLGKVIFHKPIETKKIIEVRDSNGEILSSEVLSSDKELILEKPSPMPKGKMFNYWSIAETKDRLRFTPIFVDEKEHIIRLNAMEGGSLIEDSQKIKELFKPVTKGEVLEDVLPEVKPDTNHKFLGWYETHLTVDYDEEEKKVDTAVKVTDSKGNYYAKFYPDVNDNDIDDRTEDITIRFDTGYSYKMNNVNMKVGEYISLPNLERKDYIFMGWFEDADFKNKINTENPMTEDMKIFAQWKQAEKVVEDSKEKPITDKDISDQVEKYLNDHLKDLKPPAPTISETKPNTPSKNGTGSSVSKNGTGIKPQPEQQPQQPTQQQPVVNVYDNKGDKDSEKELQGNVEGFKQEVYVFNNKNQKSREDFMVKFFDEDDSFLFSLALPYGETIITLDEKERKKKEYGVRQDTSITLKTSDYISKDSFLLGYETRRVKENASILTEVYPEVKEETFSAADFEKELAEKEKPVNSKISIVTIILGALALVTALLLAVFFIKKRKHKSNSTTEI